MRRYKIAFFVVLAAAILLGGAAVYLLYQAKYHPRPMPAMRGRCEQIPCERIPVARGQACHAADIGTRRAETPSGSVDAAADAEHRRENGCCGIQDSAQRDADDRQRRGG